MQDTSNPTPAAEVSTKTPDASRARKPRRMARAPEAAGLNDQSKPIVPRTSKTDLALGLLSREQGASLDELISATGWLPHSARAVLSGFRKKGHPIEKAKVGDTTRYQIKEAAQ